MLDFIIISSYDRLQYLFTQNVNVGYKVVMKKIPMTALGVQKLKDELTQLKSVDRPSIIDAIEEARGHGDLSENAEYHAAREKQGFIEARIKMLETKIPLADVIDVRKLTGKEVKFGATVVLCDTENDKRITYQIVGDEESNITNGLLSINAPLARALIGKNVGQEVEVKTPGGEKYYEIMEVKFI